MATPQDFRDFLLRHDDILSEHLDDLGIMLIYFLAEG